MNPIWSPHAQDLLANILRDLKHETGLDNAMKWRERIIGDVDQLKFFPELGPRVPVECFLTPPQNLEHLHQLIIKRYRAVYEITDGQVAVLSFRKCKQLLRETDTYWNDSPDEDLGADPDDLIYRS